MGEVFISSSESSSNRAQTYEMIENQVEKSWYLIEAQRPFEVFTSIHSAGSEIDPANPLDFRDLKDVSMKMSRRILGGNVSVAPQLGPQSIGHEAKILDAETNLQAFFETIGVRPGAVHVLNGLQSGHESPEALLPLDLDNYDAKHGVDPINSGGTRILLEDRSDLLYTYNPDVILAATPADCPIMFATGETPRGTISTLVHFSWRGVAHNYVARTAQRFKELEIDPSSLRVYLSAGAHGEHFLFRTADDPRTTFPLAKELFKDVRNENGAFVYGIDTPLYVYNQVVTLIADGDASKVFADVTDTADTRVGQSSHNFNFNFDPYNNTRDIVAMKPAGMEPVQEQSIPPEILQEITTVPVRYRDFNGETHHGSIEMNRAVADDVALFFETAYRLNFPIFHVGHSKDYYDDDALLMDRNISSGFNYRPIKGTRQLSLHSRGLAFDVNPRINPFIRYTPNGVEVNPAGVLYDSSKPGTLYSGHPLVTLMKLHGWEWGGDWAPESGRTDYQHFQKPPQ